MRKLILPDLRQFRTRYPGIIGDLTERGEESWCRDLPERVAGPQAFEKPLEDSGFAKLELANRHAAARRYYQERMNPQALVELQGLFTAGAIAIVDPAAERRAAARARRFRYSKWKGR